MSVVKRGNYSIVQGETKESFDPFKGYLIETSYEGDEIAIRSQMQVLAAVNPFPWSLQLTVRTSPISGESYATLNAQRAIDTILPAPVWTINGVKVEENIFDAKELPFVAGLTSEIKAGIEYRIKNPSSKKPLTTSGTLTDEQAVNAEILLSLAQIGIESKRVSTVEVKRTVIIPNQYVSTWNLNFVDKIISRNTLINAFGCPFYLQPILPLSDAILEDENGLTSVAGYLVDQPDYDTIDNGKRVSQSQRFTWDVWSVLPYGIYEWAG